MKKKLIAIGLSVCLAFGSVLTAGAAEEDSASMEKVLIAVKNVIAVPDTYDNFDYSSQKYDNGETRWNFEWSQTNAGGNISVTADSQGELLHYNSYNRNREDAGIGSVTADQAGKIALEFTERVLPKYAGKIRVETNNSYPGDNSRSIRLRLYEGEIPICFVSFYAEVNKYNGEVTYFANDSSGMKGMTLAPSEKDIGMQEAQKKYIAALGTDVKYYTSVDYKEKKRTVFPAYSLNDDSLRYVIDAAAGEKIKLYQDSDKTMRYMDAGGSGFTPMANKEASALTEQELGEIGEVKGLISKKEAEEIIRSAGKGVSGSVSEASLNKDGYESDKFIWSLLFTKGRGAVNAKTGELLSFSYYENRENRENKDNRNKKPAITAEDAQKQAEQLLTEAASEKLSQCKLNTVLSEIKAEDSHQDEYYFEYVRQVNGVDYVDNGLTVQVDKYTGKIVSYSNVWYDNVTFPAIDNVISKEDAFKKISEYGHFGKMYCKTGENTGTAVYNFLYDDKILAEPFQGGRLTSDGKPYRDAAGMPEYTDIAGHWCESVVTSLAEDGYSLPGDKFLPDSFIRQRDFLKFMYPQYAEEENWMYERAIDKGLLTEAEKKPGELVTRQEAAKLLAGYIGCSEVGEKTEIFNNPFQDDIAAEYKGYAAICYGFGILKGDAEGNFHGGDNMTRAQAASAIYNMLQKDVSGGDIIEEPFTPASN